MNMGPEGHINRRILETIASGSPLVERRWEETSTPTAPSAVWMNDNHTSGKPHRFQTLYESEKPWRGHLLKSGPVLRDLYTTSPSCDLSWRGSIPLPYLALLWMLVKLGVWIVSLWQLWTSTSAPSCWHLCPFRQGSLPHASLLSGSGFVALAAQLPIELVTVPWGP